jgi:hypothetical protein
LLAIASHRAAIELEKSGCTVHVMISSISAASAASNRESLGGLSDADLLVATRLLVGRSNQLLAELLAHLAEVEARGAHRTRACSSLYAYCIYELRFSEDEAYRRVTAARLVRRFPLLRGAVATGELHLTGLLMLGPHLTEQNVVEVLARAKHRTKKEISQLVRQLDPLPDVPARIEPLDPPPARLVPKSPTWSEFVQSTCPVRELTPGDRPRDWMDDAAERANDFESEAMAPAELEVQKDAEPPEPPTPTLSRLAPERFSVQFTASEEYVQLVEEARALLSHSTPPPALDELHLRALRSLVAELKRQKYAVTTRPRQPSPNAIPTARTDEPAEVESLGSGEESGQSPPVPRRRGRYVPAHVRRVVFERDDARCTYTDDSGQRCRETHGLELHHLLAFARGGEPTERNLTLRCRAHNALAAEEDFGRDFIEHQRESAVHESWRTAEGGAPKPCLADE